MASKLILDRLEGVSQVGAGWKALCPAHADRKASLSICERDGRVLVHCHAGCSTAEVLEAIDLGWDALFDGGRHD